MKRNLGLALIATLVLVLTFLLLPTSLAKRNESSLKHSSASGQLDPNLFRVNKQDENAAGPIAMRAVNFAESIPVRDMPAAAPRPWARVLGVVSLRKVTPTSGNLA